MQTFVSGYPRIGAHRELKFATEQFFSGKLSAEELQKVAADIRAHNWQLLAQNGIDYIPSGDFSFYDNVLDASILFGLLPERFADVLADDVASAFAPARGTEGKVALALRKWFTTNYHYLVPECDASTQISLRGQGPIKYYQEAKALGIETIPSIIGPFTLLKLTSYSDNRTAQELAPALALAVKQLLVNAAQSGASWFAFDEPALVLDLSAEDKKLLTYLYELILANRKQKVLIRTSFGDIRDAWDTICAVAPDGISLDFDEGAYNLELLKQHPLPASTTLFAGLIRGRGIWCANYDAVLARFEEIRKFAPNAVLGTACSLLHVPVTTATETVLDKAYTAYFSFAQEKVQELSVLSLAESSPLEAAPLLNARRELLSKQRTTPDEAVNSRVAALKDSDFTRLPARTQRLAEQQLALKLPVLPTTTIGSFPQTAEVRALRRNLRQGNISLDAYNTGIKNEIKACIKTQEELGLDVLVHGEFERNDMVEYFGEHLNGFIFTSNGWVQSYGTRCVKPPVVWGDVSRKNPITVETACYAQSLTSKPVKGMLTGPVTICNWSFLREDLDLKTIMYQVALAVRDEVLDLEQAGIKVIQIDEAALREKLPLKKSRQVVDYLEFAVPAFRLTASGVKADTQIHTHMCYSEFRDILPWIDAMDADVISFEAARSGLSLLESLKVEGFGAQIGPGVYDIHSPVIPKTSAIKERIESILKVLPVSSVWINPDCGLKTRKNEECLPSLANMMCAVKEVRASLN